MKSWSIFGSTAFKIGALLSFVIVLPAACLISGSALAIDQVVVQRHDRHFAAGASIEGRVKTLSRALDLDAGQQAELRKVLEGQREEVRKLWSDVSVPAAYRVSATQAVSDKTADRIRALLNEEQRKKYNPPKAPHEAMADSTTPSVEDWMDAARTKSARHE